MDIRDLQPPYSQGSWHWPGARCVAGGFCVLHHGCPAHTLDCLIISAGGSYDQRHLFTEEETGSGKRTCLKLPASAWLGLGFRLVYLPSEY